MPYFCICGHKCSACQENRWVIDEHKKAPLCKGRLFPHSGRYFDKILLNIFTSRKNCDIIIMPNNLNIHSYRSFSRYGITITFFAIQLGKLVLVKTLLLLDCIENLCYEEIVWRQLELAFFGALTSVGALFYFRR